MKRIDYFATKPEFIQKLRKGTKEQEAFTLDPKLRALVETRVSQINGCVYCTDLHTREARDRGEVQRRLDLLAVWKESPLFDEREKSALGWAESMTNLATSGADDGAYLALCAYFSDTEIVELSISVSIANFWNRMAAGFRKVPTDIKSD